MARKTAKAKQDERIENEKTITLNFINKSERQLKGLLELFKGEWSVFHAEICNTNPVKFGGHITVDKQAHEKKVSRYKRLRKR